MRKAIVEGQKVNTCVALVDVIAIRNTMSTKLLPLTSRCVSATLPMLRSTLFSRDNVPVHPARKIRPPERSRGNPVIAVPFQLAALTALTEVSRVEENNFIVGLFD